MFPILLAELRPLFFRHRFWSDKDESFKAVFDVLTPHANSLIIRFLDRVILLEARHLVEARIAMKSSSLHADAQKGTSRVLEPTKSVYLSQVFQAAFWII